MSFYPKTFSCILRDPKLLIAACVIVLAAPSVVAQTSIYQEQSKLIRAPRSLTALGSELLGDKVNLYTGGLEFVQTDVSLPGNNNLPVSVGRRLITGQFPVDGTPFGRWDLEIPHLHGVFAKSTGWPDARCSAFGAPPMVSGYLGSSWAGSEYWHGSFLYVPGAGEQEMLTRSATYTPAPTGTGYSYPLVTRNNWAIRCLSSLAAGNGATGEGFVAVSPDGTQYQFDWLVTRAMTALQKSNMGPAPLSAPAPSSSMDMRSSASIGPPNPSPDAADLNSLPRVEVWLLPTIVTDRFGNSVTYTYDTTNKWQLKTIVSNDVAGSPRTITFTYATPGSTASNLVSSVSDGTRTWIYSYTGSIPATSNLSTVTQPDGSTWQLGGIMPLLQPIQYLGEGSCDSPGYLNTSTSTGYMVHPSGARGDFTLTPTSHGRSGVEYICTTDATYMTSSPRYPKIFDTMALTNKTISGPGLPQTQWNTTYSAGASSWAPCNGCVTNKQVSVTDPGGARTVYNFGTLYRETEGDLQETDFFEGSGASPRTLTVTYGEPLAGPVGISSQIRGDGDLAARLRVPKQRVTRQQDVNFVWQADVFDTTYGRATQVTRWNSTGTSRTETNLYNNNTAKWVIGQLQRVTESSTGKVMVDNGYNPATATLESVSRFGVLQQSMTYYGDGTLATRKDGLNHTTTFTNYKRGLAQNVQYPDGSTESAVVDNIGNISSTTDANGYLSNYEYDAIGRLHFIYYAAGDSVAWNPTRIDYSQVGAQEYDLSAGHWRQDLTTGNARTSTYYDALWRPVYTYTADLGVANTDRVVKRNYDFAGRTTFESYPKRSTGSFSDGVTTTYDALGRVFQTSASSELGALNTNTNYLTNFQKSVTDPRGNTSVTSFQAFDEASESAISNIAAPLGVNVAIARDIFGKPKSITRSDSTKSVTRSYVYDSGERLCKTIEPETASTVQFYDAASNVAWRASGVALPATTSCDTASVAANKMVTFGYDTLNRLTSTSYSDGSPVITRTYTPDGLPFVISSNGAVWTNSYNRRRLNERESLVYGGATYNIDRTYDPNGSLLQLKYPDSTTVGYNPNALGEPRQVGTYAGSITYHPSGAIASFTYGNGITHSMTQNVRALPHQSIDTGVISDQYSYDANANVTGIADLLAPSVSSRTMTYDDLDRLKTVSSPSLWGSASYTYDALDNLTATAITGGSTARSTSHTINPATNRIDSISGGPAGYNFTYGYDSQGNITQRGAQVYVFDQGNRMSSATGKATYGYDGLGHRFTVVGTDGVNRVQVYSQAGQLLYVRGTSVPLTAGTKYIYLNRHQIAEVKAAGAN